VEVLVGSARVRLNAASLKRVGSARAPRPAGVTSIQLVEDRLALPLDPELDLRGLRLQESLERLDQFLDSALTMGRHHVRVIHGKGTGTLRQGVWKHLANHLSVQHYDFADAQHGGNGATEVELG